MKKRINLFSRKKRFNAFAVYAVKIRRYGTVAGILLFFVFMFIIYNMVKLQKDIQELTKKKQLFLSVLLNEKDDEANIRYFKGKQTQLMTFEADDARFLPYYLVLANVLKASDSAVLDTIEIDKNRNTVFTVKFGNYDLMIAFLKYVESEEFLGNFDSLSMSSLSLSHETERRAQEGVRLNNNYQLEFKGKFKEIHDESG